MGIESIKKEIIVSGPVEAVYDPLKSVGLCRRPYPGHPNGCPNWGKKNGCPPNADVFVNICEPIVVVVAVNIDYKEYLGVRRQEQPNWTDKALANTRHFQGSLRAQLKRTMEDIVKEDEIGTTNGEAMGVNVDATCRKVGIELEWPPKNNFYQIGLLVRPKIKSVDVSSWKLQMKKGLIK